jgi:RNA polymerase sigma-70 factor (ECF subfamily)
MPLHHHHTGIDADFLEKLVSGDRRAQRELYDRYAPRMYALCLRYTSGADLANDLLQEGFIKVYMHLHQYRGQGPFEGWMRRIFVNTAIEQLRKRVIWKHTDGDLPEDLAEQPGSAYDNLALKDLLRLVQSLPDGYRTVFNLYVVEGHSHRQIADMLGINEGTSKSQLSRAKAILQKQITVLQQAARRDK